jgi:hypothetical protein
MDPEAEAIAALGDSVLAVSQRWPRREGLSAATAPTHPRRGESKSARSQRSLATATVHHQRRAVVDCNHGNRG